MMMKTPPAPALVVTQAEILLEVLVVALDTPTHLGLIDHALPGGQTVTLPVTPTH